MSTMKTILILPAIIMISFTLFSSQIVNASGPLDLTGVGNFAILANTYTNADATTVLHGDLGYTVPPATPPTVTGVIISSPSSTYTAAETKQASLIANANDQTQTGACTLSLTPATDLGSISPLAPGVYCITGAVSITTTATLSGNGVYIFRLGGALGTTAGSTLTLTGGATADNVFWVPVGAVTLGDGSTFAGNIMTNAAITVGSHVSMNGRILSNGAVTTGTFDSITPPQGSVTSIPDFPFSFSLVIMFVAVAAVYMGVRQKLIPGFKRF